MHFLNELKCILTQVSQWFKIQVYTIQIKINLIICVGASDTALKIKFSELNEKIERISKLIHFILVKLTLAGVELPAFFITLINYFIYDLKDDSYYFSFPIMYVSNPIQSNQLA